LDLGTEFLIKTNNRKILDGLLDIVGIKDDKELF
jgi:histidyl-tRNA synthetase